jgi:hypothetical protein
VPDYDHWGFVEASRPAWEIILPDLTTLRAGLEELDKSCASRLPYGSVLDVQASFETSSEANERALAKFIFDLDQWLHQTLKGQEIISILGL